MEITYKLIEMGEMILRAFVVEQGKLQLKEMPEPEAKNGEVIVRLKVAGLNRRDLYIKKRWENKSEALILGSDGAGTIESIGKGVTQFQIGDEVMINPSLNWDKNSNAPPEGFDILGMPENGTFAEKIALPVRQVERIPHHFTWEEAGVFVLSALTGYRALFTKGNVQKGDTVFIPGVGSGVATYMVQFANAIGAKVIVSSREEHKKNKALEIGATIVIDTNSDWEHVLADESIDLVIDSVGGATFNRSLKVLNKGGRIVTFGATTDDIVSLNLRQFFYGQYQLFGSTMGSRDELKDLITLMEKYALKPIVGKSFTLNHIQTAFNYLENSEQFGKIAITME